MASTPLVGATGLYEFEAPFDVVATPSVAYTCIALRTMSEMQSWGKNPFTYVYVPRNIPLDRYEQDARNQVRLVTLRNEQGHEFIVPASFIKAAPLLGGVPYTVMVLAAKLGAIPDTLDLSALEAKVEDVIKANVGITPTIEQVKISQTQLIDASEHERLELIRQGLIATTATLTSENLALQATIEQLRTQNELLQAYIAENIP